jgi:hypothetical protein
MSAEPAPVISAEAVMGAEPMPDPSMVKMRLVLRQSSTTGTGGSAANSSTRSSPSMLIWMPAARRLGAQRARPCA